MLLRNYQTAIDIAAKVKVSLGNDVVLSDTHSFQISQQLILQHRALYISIANKLEVVIPIVPEIGGRDLTTQNHLLLLGNRLIVWAIAQKLQLPMLPFPQLNGSMMEQNHQLLLGNQNTLKAIVAQIGAIATWPQSPSAIVLGK